MIKIIMCYIFIFSLLDSRQKAKDHEPTIASIASIYLLLISLHV